MKKTIHIVFIALVGCNALFCQKAIVNPDYGFSENSCMYLKSLIINDTSTILGFHYWGPEFVIPSGSYIKDIKGDKKLYIKSAVGLTIGKRVVPDESDRCDFKLVFPAMDTNNLCAIDYGIDGGSIVFYDIRIKPKPSCSLVPAEARGCWFSADNNYYLEYAFLDSFLVADSKVWQYKRIEPSEDRISFVVTHGQDEKTIWFRRQGNGCYAIGADDASMKVCSQKQALTGVNAGSDTGEFDYENIKPDTAVYRGYITGYTSRIKKNAGFLSFYNALTLKQESTKITINKDGSFDAKLPLAFPVLAFAELSSYLSYVYLEPGKEVFQLVDGDNKEKPLNMGELAWDNAGLSNLYYDLKPDDPLYRGKAVMLNGADYKKWCLAKKDSIDQCINSLVEDHKMSSKVAKIFKAEIQCNIFTLITKYNDFRESSYRRIHQIPDDQQNIPLERVQMTPIYMNFIETMNFNDPCCLSTSEIYYFMLNPIWYSEAVRKEFRRFPVKEASAAIRRAGMELTPEDQRALYKIDSIQNSSSPGGNDYYSLVESIRKKYQKIMVPVEQRAFLNAGLKFLDETPGLNTILLKDVVKSQTYMENIRNYLPYSQPDLDSISKDISTPLIRSYICYKNSELIKMIEANKKKTGYTINQKLEYEGEKLFDVMMEKYKGKIVLVDFWATWCAPCRLGIQEVAPLKEELADKDIEFVYITDPTSPEELWKNLIMDIKGQHYRLSTDDWNSLRKKFSIHSIPHYALIDKSGTIVNPDLGHKSNEDLKKILLNLDNAN